MKPGEFIGRVGGIFYDGSQVGVFGAKEKEEPGWRFQEKHVPSPLSPPDNKGNFHSFNVVGWDATAPRYCLFKDELEQLGLLKGRIQDIVFDFKFANPLNVLLCAGKIVSEEVEIGQSCGAELQMAGDAPIRAYFPKIRRKKKNERGSEEAGSNYPTATRAPAGVGAG